MVVGLHRSLAEQDSAYEELQEAAEGSYEMTFRIYHKCRQIAQETGNCL